ncbi:MAG: iron-sulfur cluster assembly accessory protein [Nanoarchaeota archaeon]|nr:iron-sulfur cluster assembly accessory protein [Nanoarchaeota archaeon]
MTEQLLITKDMPIGDVVEKYPEAAEVFTAYGLHCVGCHVSPLETVEQGALGHGMDEATFNEMLSEANKVATGAASEPVVDSSQMDVTMTEKAVSKVKEVLVTENEKAGKELFFRIGVAPGGCSGFSYVMHLDDEKLTDDKEFDKSGLKVLIDKRSLAKLNGSTIDYVETLQQSGFKIDNPNAKKGCGCGHSFG